MAAPTPPQSAFTDGIHAAPDTILWTLGFLTALIPIAATIALVVIWAHGESRDWRHRYTAWRIRRTHTRSGR